MPPRPFQINVAQSTLDDLRHRLAATRWAEPIPGTGWDYGADVNYVRDFCEYWRSGYDWRLHEARLNELPQFVVPIDGVDVHFWHVKGKSPAPFPLLLMHGWPGSMFEFFRLVEPLTDPAAAGGEPVDAFDVVIPALPGFGFGGKPAESGWSVARIAKAMDTLMHDELGYDRYGVQGGDWGGIISAKMASEFEGRVAAAHLNFVIAQPPENPAEDDKAAIAARAAFQAQETGYSAVQGTKPMSLAISQADSPAGLAAWILEKFRTWSDCSGDLESVYSRDDLITNLMFYWAPNSIASAARIYFESSRDRSSFAYDRPSTPVGVAVFPKEPWRVPRNWAEARYNIQRWTEMPRGGHFAAMEQPGLLVEDIRAFFRDYR
jgi:epoxide hydrolase